MNSMFRVPRFALGFAVFCLVSQDCGSRRRRPCPPVEAGCSRGAARTASQKPVNWGLITIPGHRMAMNFNGEPSPKMVGGHKSPPK